jgi:hypothetical protein
VLPVPAFAGSTSPLQSWTALLLSFSEMGRYWFKPGRPLRQGVATVCLAAFLFFGYDQYVSLCTLIREID